MSAGKDMKENIVLLLLDNCQLAYLLYLQLNILLHNVHSVVKSAGPTGSRDVGGCPNKTKLKINREVEKTGSNKQRNIHYYCMRM